MKLNIKSAAKTAIYSCALLICSGCQDFIERDHPTGITDDKFWGTMNECEAALNECKLWVKGAYGGMELGMGFFDGATDNMYFFSNFEQRIVMLGNGSLVPLTETNDPSGWEDFFKSWKNYYERIRRCNRFLEHVDQAYFTEESERTRMKVEARVWRAWYHIRLLLWYGRNDGIPIVKKSLNPEEIYMERQPIDICLEEINKDLDYAIRQTDPKICPFVWDEGRRDRMSRSVALTLKMDVNLQFHKYDIALAAARKIINAGVFQLHYKGGQKPTLGDGSSYRALFQYSGENNKERILFRENGMDNIWFRYMPQSLSGQGVAAPLKSLIDTYETLDGKPLDELTAAEKLQCEHNPLYKARDPRLSATIMMPGDQTSISNYEYKPFDSSSSDYVGKTGTSRSGYLLKKYIDENDRASGNGTLDFMIYRYAEVLLDYVECQIQLGKYQKDPKVKEYIDAIRERAGMPKTPQSLYSDKDKLWELYKRERRVELCFEGKRYDDIRRWGIGQEAMNGPIYGAWDSSKNEYVFIETRNCTFPKYDSWPLPQQEVTSNPNIHQPTGW